MRLTSGTTSLTRASCFPPRLQTKGAQSGHVAARSSKACSESERDRVPHVDHDDGNRRCRAVCCHRRRGCRRHDHIRGELDKVAGKGGKATVLTLRPPVLDDDVLALDQANLTETPSEFLHGQLCICPDGRAARKKADQRELPCRLLRPGGERRGE